LKLATDKHQVNSLKLACLNLSAFKLSDSFDKNANISEYDASCQEKGIDCEITSIKKGEPSNNPTNYPTIYQLVRECSMKPSLDHQYWVSDLSLDNVIVVFLKCSKSFLTSKEIERFFSRSTHPIKEMVRDVLEFRMLDFSKL
jgi:hypothetical protein